MPDLTGPVHAGTIWEDTRSRVPTRKDPLLMWAQPQKPHWVGPLARAKGAQHIHTHSHAQMYHNTIKRSMLPWSRTHLHSPSLPRFLSISPILSLSGESVYPQSVGIVQLLRKCTKCFLLCSVEPLPSTVESGNCTESPNAHHSRCQHGFGLHA